MSFNKSALEVLTYFFCAALPPAKVSRVSARRRENLKASSVCWGGSQHALGVFIFRHKKAQTAPGFMLDPLYESGKKLLCHKF